MFKANADTEAFCFNELDGFAQGDALLSEACRQVGDAIQTTVSTWTRDISDFACILRSWVPAGWTVDNVKELLAASGEHAAVRKSLLNNTENYPNLGQGANVLEAGTELLTKLNISGHPVLVPASYLEDMTKTSGRARDCVVVTFALYLLFDKLPRVSTKEAREAEVESFYSTLPKDQVVPADLKKALDARIKGTVAK